MSSMTCLGSGTKPASIAVALVTKSSKASVATSREGTPTTISPSTPSGSRLVVMIAKRAAMPQDVRDEGGNGVEHVLAVVEHQQDLALADPLDERGASRGAGTGDEADGRGDDGLDLVSRVRRRELDEPRATGHFLAQRSRRGEREASLADAARTGQRDEA